MDSVFVPPSPVASSAIVCPAMLPPQITEKLIATTGASINLIRWSLKLFTVASRR
jgi:hypothetical protein